MTAHHTESETASVLSPISRVILLLGCWTVTLIGAIYLIIPSGILPLIEDDLHIGSVGAGWLISLPYAAEAIGAIPLGIILDRVRAPRLLAVGIVLISAASGLGAITSEAGNYNLLLASRFLGGMAYMAIWLSAIQLISISFPERTATAVGILTTSGPAGLTIGLPLGGLVATRMDWYNVFWVILGALVVAGALVALVTRLIDMPDRRTRTARPLHGISLAITNRPVLLIALMAFVTYSLFLLFSSWMPSYFADTYGLSLVQSSLLTSVFPAVGILARSAGGIVSDYVLDGDAQRVLRLSFLALLPIVSIIALEHSVVLLLFLLLLSGFFVQTGVGVYFSYGPTFVDESAQGTAIAVLNTAALTGSFTAPIVAGWIISASEDFSAIFGYALGLCLLGLGSALLLPTADR